MLQEIQKKKYLEVKKNFSQYLKRVFKTSTDNIHFTNSRAFSYIYFYAFIQLNYVTSDSRYYRFGIIREVVNILNKEGEKQPYHNYVCILIQSYHRCIITCVFDFAIIFVLVCNILIIIIIFIIYFIIHLKISKTNHIQLIVYLLCFIFMYRRI